MGADDPLHNRAVSIEQEALGHTGGLIRLLNGGRAILKDVESQMEGLSEVPDIRRIAFVDAHGGDLEAPGLEGVVEALHGLRGAAPRRNLHRAGAHTQHFAPGGDHRGNRGDHAERGSVAVNLLSGTPSARK